MGEGFKLIGTSTMDWIDLAQDRNVDVSHGVCLLHDYFTTRSGYNLKSLPNSLIIF